MSNKSRSFPLAGFLFALLLMAALVNPGKADELTLSVSLGLSPQQAVRHYQPLLDYLAQATGKRIRLEASTNSLAHWQMMRREVYDMVLDNPALTAYRVARMDYTVIAKMPDVLSFTLVAHADQMMFEPSELIGLNVAGQPSPSLVALSLGQVYDNPMRQPNFVQVQTHMEAVRSVLEGRASGAILPTGMISGFPNLNPLYTTDQLPAPGFSVSARVSPELRDTIRRALLDAQNSPEGRAMLESLNVPNLEPATNVTFAGLEILLEDQWGY